MPEPEVHTIELDCPPGSPRPDDLLPGVLKGTGVEIDPQKTVTRFFGCWEWVVPEQYREAYEKHLKTIEARIKRLYEAGTIRYGSW